MGHQGGATWTEEHTDSLNALLRIAASKLHLAVANWEVEMELTVDLLEGDIVGGVVLSQGSGKHRRLVAMVGRDLTTSEQSWTYPEQVLGLACWGMRRLYRWTGFVPRVTVVLPRQHCLVMTRDKGVHAKLRSHVLELGMYGVAYQVRENQSVVLSQLREAVEAALEGDAEGAPEL